MLVERFLALEGEQADSAREELFGVLDTLTGFLMIFAVITSVEFLSTE